MQTTAIENINKAHDLIYQAYEEESENKARKLIAKAIKLDPNNADAYNFLGSISDDCQTAISYFEKGMKAGKHSIGESAYQELKGHFWGFHETRPFMRAKAGVAECLNELGKKDQAIKHYQEMLILNPNDNQGIRSLLMTLLIETRDFVAFRKLKKIYKGEITADWLYNIALYQFIQNGDCKQANKAIVIATEINKYVLDYLFGRKDLPDEVSDFYSIGSDEEAILYVGSNGHLWLDTKDALHWLAKQVR